MDASSTRPVPRPKDGAHGVREGVSRDLRARVTFDEMVREIGHTSVNGPFFTSQLLCRDSLRQLACGLYFPSTGSRGLCRSACLHVSTNCGRSPFHCRSWPTTSCTSYETDTTTVCRRPWGLNFCKALEYNAELLTPQMGAVDVWRVADDEAKRLFEADLRDGDNHECVMARKNYHCSMLFPQCTQAGEAIDIQPVCRSACSDMVEKCGADRGVDCTLPLVFEDFDASAVDGDVDFANCHMYTMRGSASQQLIFILGVLLAATIIGIVHLVVRAWMVRGAIQEQESDRSNKSEVVPMFRYDADVS